MEKCGVYTFIIITCKKLGRNFIGIDIDANSVTTSLLRLQDNAV